MEELVVGHQGKRTISTEAIPKLLGEVLSRKARALGKTKCVEIKSGRTMKDQSFEMRHRRLNFFRGIGYIRDSGKTSHVSKRPRKYGESSLFVIERELFLLTKCMDELENIKANGFDGVSVVLLWCGELVFG
jgi:hypothetical protein